jgi:hypothetical protein
MNSIIESTKATAYWIHYLNAVNQAAAKFFSSFGSRWKGQPDDTPRGNRKIDAGSSMGDGCIANDAGCEMSSARRAG